METVSNTLVVHGFAMREGRGKWACCYEIRLVTADGELLLYRGELHGRRYATEAAAASAAREAGEGEARRHQESVREIVASRQRDHAVAAHHE